MAVDRRAAVESTSSVDWMQQFSIQAVWTALIVAFLWLILNRHRFGEHTLFIGDSNDVSRVVGIDVDREKIKIFTLMGVLAAVAAIMLTLENKNFFGNQGQGYLLTAIASVLIGGTSISADRRRSSARSLAASLSGWLKLASSRRAYRRLGAHSAGTHLPDRHHFLHVCRRAAAAHGVCRPTALVQGFGGVKAAE